MTRTTWSLVGPLLLVACSGAVDDPRSNRRSMDDPTSGNASTSDTNGGGRPTFAPAPATIRVHYPAGASKIGVRGTGASLSPNTTTPLNPGADDTWELALGEISTIVDYTPTLDDQPAKGPSYAIEPGEVADIYPYFKAAKGEVVTKWTNFASTILPSNRNIRVYTPPSYKENTRARYPVLYVHDGQTTFAASISPNQIIDGCLAVDTAMDQGVEAGKIAEAIVVAIDNGSAVSDLTGQQRGAELTPTPGPELKNSGQGPKYASMVIDEIKPMVDKEYRTRPERENTFTIGSSLGGLMAAFLGYTRGDVFGAYGSQSGSYWWDKQSIVNEGKGAIAGPNKPLRVYIDYGDAEVKDPEYHDQLVVPTDAMLKVLHDGGYVDGQTLVFNLGAKGGGHNSKTWATRIPAALPFLIGPGR